MRIRFFSTWTEGVNIIILIPNVSLSFRDDTGIVFSWLIFGVALIKDGN